MVDASTLLLVHFILETRTGSSLAGVPQEALRAQLLDAAAAIDITVLAAEFEPDHGHVFAAIKPSQTVDFVIKRLKSGLVKPLMASGALPATFGWKGGSPRAYSVSASRAQRVAAYIQGQAERHASMSLEEELAELERRHGAAATGLA